ncbi:MAG: peptidoglycan-binding protein, partial [Thermodesulfobacteriota bacterium]
VSLINDYLFQIHGQGRRAVLILEEAQNLKPEVLEQVRLLTNLETKEHKLLQMIMIGQPELKEILSQPQLLQLSQRITARYHLGPLSKEEILQYINYRLSIAGMDRNRLFPPSTVKKLFRLSGGLPRLINVICDRALLGTFVQGKDQVDKKTLIKAAREVSGDRGARRLKFLTVQPFLAVFLLVLFAALGTAFYLHRSGPLPEVITKKVVQPIDPMGRKTILVKDTLERPKDMTGEETKERAYDVLFKKWSLAYRPGDVIVQARAQGLRCLKQRGDLSRLARMNKPAVLTLRDKKKTPYYATLTSLGEKTATLAIGLESRTVDLPELAQCWSGEYLLFWRLPPEYGKSQLRPGGRGPLVAWVQKHLELAQGRTVSNKPKEEYDREMVNQVKEFQAANGLKPDGIVGPKTIMPLTAFIKDGEPVLRHGNGGL